MIEPLILGSLLHNEEYTRKVLPFLEEEYFDSLENKLIYRTIDTYIKDYNSVPTKDALRLSLEESRSVSEEQFDVICKTVDELSYDEKNSEEKKPATLEEELEDTISVDVAADLFEKAPEKKSLNDTFQKNLQIGLNDRIAFVKHLFNNSQADFNRVLSQLNSFKTEKEAIKFINKMVKPDYNWSEQEEFEARFMEIIQRKFV